MSDAGKGDRSSTSDEEFVGRMTSCQRELRSLILGLIPHQVDADDVLQEVNLALWRKRHLYDPELPFVRWAFGFAALEVRSHRSRAAKTNLWFSETTIDLLASEWPRSASFVDEARQTLAACLQKLGDKERQVVEDRYSRRLSAKQIAENSGRPLRTVYKQLNRALDSLRMCIKRSQAQ